MKIELIGSSSAENSSLLSNEETINMLLHQANNKSHALYPFPGRTLYRTLAGSSPQVPIRSMSVSFSEADPSFPDLIPYKLAVAAGNLIYSYRVNSGNPAITVTPIETTRGYVEMVECESLGVGRYLMVDGVGRAAGGAYIYNKNTEIMSAMTDVDYPSTATSGYTMDQFTVVNSRAVGENTTFFVSAAADATAWSALDIAKKTTDSTKIQKITGLANYLLIMGDWSTEFWQKVNNVDFPFQKIPALTLNVGCVAPGSVVPMNNQLVFLSSDRTNRSQIVTLSPGAVKLVSSKAITEIISSMGYIEDARAWAVNWLGNPLYVITFPTERKTFCFNFNTNTWTRLKSFNRDDYNISFYAYFAGQHIVADSEGPFLYKLDSNTYTDNGDIIERVRRTQFIEVDGDVLVHNSLELEFEPGVANSDSADPKVALRWSDDSGKTWSGYKYRSLGAVGAHNQRVIFRMLGRSRKRQYEITVTDPVKTVLRNAWVDVTQVTRRLTAGDV